MRRLFGVAVSMLFVGVGTACGGGGGGASQASFCGLLKDGASKYRNLGDMSDAKSTNEVLSFLRGLESKAPSEIKADMKLLVDAIAEFAQKNTVPDLAKLEAAGNNVTKYAKDKCGVDIDSSSSSSGNAAGSLRSDSSSPTVASGDARMCTDLISAQELGSGFGKDVMARLRAITPPAELKTEWKDFLDGTEAYLANNFSDEALMQRFEQASTKVADYIARACAGISPDTLSSSST